MDGVATLQDAATHLSTTQTHPLSHSALTYRFLDDSESLREPPSDATQQRTRSLLLAERDGAERRPERR